MIPDDLPAADRPSVRRRRRRTAAAATALLAAVGLGTGLGVAFGEPGSSPSGSSSSSYDYYRAVMARYGSGSMMGGGVGWMAGRSGFTWMTGGASAPAWMRGQALPGFMATAGGDPGTVMGSLFADAPGPRVSRSTAARLGDAVPAGAKVDRAANRVAFTTSTVRFTVLASPSMPAESFRIAGMTDPTVVVPAGAKVTIELVNADADMAHGLVVTARGAAASSMPMMTSPPAFTGAALWFLGERSAAGMHEGTIAFSASAAGTYAYLCPVPGHAQEGMVGTFVVARSRAGA